MATINDCIMSLRKCEKLMAPKTLKRVVRRAASDCLASRP